MAVGHYQSNPSTETNSATSCTISFPASTGTGGESNPHLCLVVAFNRDKASTATIADNSGIGSWTSLKTQSDSASTLSLWYKIVTVNHTGYTVTISNCTNSCAAAMTVLDGLTPNSTFYANLTGENNTALQLPSHAQFTSTKVGSLVLLMVGIANDYDITNTYMGGSAMSQRATRKSTGGSDCAITLATVAGPVPPGATGGFTWSHTAIASISIVVEILPKDTELTASKGTFTLTGQDVGLSKGLPMSADAGSFTLTGNDVTFARTYVLTADCGSFVLTGTDAILVRGLLLATETGSFVLTGNDSELTVGHVMTAEVGAFALTGLDVEFAATRLLSAETGAYELTGQAADLLAGLVLDAETGTFDLTGNDAELTYTPTVVAYTLDAETGEFVLAGADVDLIVQTVSREAHSPLPEEPAISLDDDDEILELLLMGLVALEESWVHSQVA